MALILKYLSKFRCEVMQIIFYSYFNFGFSVSKNVYFILIFKLVVISRINNI